MRIAVPLATIAVAVTLLAGCGSSSEEPQPSGSTAPSKADGSRAPVGAQVRSCPLAAGGVVALRATGVSCARPGEAVSFRVRG